MNVYSHFAFSYSTHNTDNLLVGWRYGAPALGFYKKAYDLFVLPETQLLAPLSAVVVSTLSRVTGDREQFQRYFLRAIAVLALVGMGIGADFSLVGKDLIRFLLGPGWEEAGRIFALFGPGIGVMLLYNTHGWVHLSIGRPERWFRWGLIEFVCTASSILAGFALGPLRNRLCLDGFVFPTDVSRILVRGKADWHGYWAAVFAVIWKFFAASVGWRWDRSDHQGGVPLFARRRWRAQSAFVRMVSVSLVFWTRYFGRGALRGTHGVQAASADTVGLFRDLLPDTRG